MYFESFDVVARELRARPLKPVRAIGGAWRGARITAVGPTTIELNVLAEASYPHIYTVAKGLFPEAAVGNPCVVRVANLSEETAIADYVIAEIGPAGWAGEPHSTERPNWGRVEYSRTNESAYWEN